jgi:hypothetical protein
MSRKFSDAGLTSKKTFEEELEEQILKEKQRRKFSLSPELLENKPDDNVFKVPTKEKTSKGSLWRRLTTFGKSIDKAANIDDNEVCLFTENYHISINLVSIYLSASLQHSPSKRG